MFSSKRMLFAGAAALFAMVLPMASQQTERKVYRVSDAGITAPRLIEKLEPSYTPEAKDAKIEGAVKLSGIIDIDGKLHEIRVEESLDSGLDDNAIAAVFQRQLRRPGDSNRRRRSPKPSRFR